MLNRKEIVDFLRSNKKNLQKKYGVRELYLYGSAVRDEITINSDVDLLLDVPVEFKKFKNYLGIKDFLKKSLKREIDIVYVDSINPVIEEEIKSEMLKIE